MRELLPDIKSWRSDGKRIALATVVRAWGSAPRPLGSAMAISSAGEISGSVSGGCVEGAVAEEAQQVLASNQARLVEYGVSNETAWSVGLSCGGRIEIFIEPIPDPAPDVVFTLLTDRLASEMVSVRAIVVAGPAAGRQLLIGDGQILAGSVGSPALDARILDRAAAGGGHSSERLELTEDDQANDVFLELHLPRPKLLIVGAVHVAIHLVALGRRLGYATVVIDPRTAFATPERFADADVLSNQWPQEALAEEPLHETTCFVFLSHDLKIDLPGLEIALRSPALYVGALGSRKTHAKRVAALEELGFSPQEIDRISAPIGFDLGGRRAEEIALAIMAEIVAVRYGRA